MKKILTWVAILLIIPLLAVFVVSFNGNKSSNKGVTVKGTQEITQNGIYDISDKANVSVNVPIPDGYLKPSGNLEITENGTYDITGKESVTVNVESSGSESNEIKLYKHSISTNYYDSSSKYWRPIEIQIISPSSTPMTTQFELGDETIKVGVLNNIPEIWVSKSIICPPYTDFSTLSETYLFSIIEADVPGFVPTVLCCLENGELIEIPISSEEKFVFVDTVTEYDVNGFSVTLSFSTDCGDTIPYFTDNGQCGVLSEWNSSVTLSNVNFLYLDFSDIVGHGTFGVTSSINGYLAIDFDINGYNITGDQTLSIYTSKSTGGSNE